MSCPTSISCCRAVAEDIEPACMNVTLEEERGPPDLRRSGGFRVLYVDIDAEVDTPSYGLASNSFAIPRVSLG